MNIKVIVVSHDRPANKLLGAWLNEKKLDWEYSARDYDVGEVRNMAVNKFLKEGTHTHLMLVDDDIVPTPDTDAILAVDSHACYCGTVGPGATYGHNRDNDWNEACCRMSDTLLKRLQYPYFKAIYDNGRRVMCDGGTFLKQARILGVHPNRVGTAGHLQTCILLPSDNKLGWAIAWPHELSL